MARVNFTAGRIDSFQCEAGKNQTFLWDSEAPGLGLRATANGAVSFIFQAKINGKTYRKTLGDPKTIKLPQAREQATELKLLVGKQEDPREVAAEKRRVKQVAVATAKAVDAAAALQAEYEQGKRELIARTAWDVYLSAERPATGKYSWGDRHRADHDSAAAPGGIACKIGGKNVKAAPLASLLAMPLHHITGQIVADWLRLECKTRPTFAHNSFRKFRAFINWCADHPDYKHVVQSDCCIVKVVKAGTPKHKTKEGDCLQREQLPAWFDAVRKIGNPVISAYLQALLLTGARRGELADLRWGDVDFQWRSMTIKDKVEGHRTIPLTPYVLSLLSVLPRRNDYVFSSLSAKSGYIEEPRIAHVKALAIAGLPHVSLHGLRRSFGTLCEWVEMPSGISAQIMGHKPSALAEKHYRRRPLDLLRKWHDTIEAWMLERASIEFTPCAPGLRIVTAA